MHVKQRVIGYRPNLSGLATPEAISEAGRKSGVVAAALRNTAPPFAALLPRPHAARSTAVGLYGRVTASTGECIDVSHLDSILEKGYTIVSRIGQGAYGVVWKCTKGDFQYALKVGEVGDEQEILRYLEGSTCSHVVLPTQLFENVIVMPLCSTSLQGGEEQRKWNMNNAHVILSGTAQGLEELHRWEICHGDIKLENIVCCADDVVKIIDLGAAAQLTGGAIPYSYMGTPMYMAPELLFKLGPVYNFKMDVWALAIVLGQCVKDPPPLIPKLIEFSNSTRDANTEQGHLPVHFLMSGGGMHVNDHTLRVPTPGPYEELFTHMLCDAADRWSSTRVCDHVLTIRGERRKVRAYN